MHTYRFNPVFNRWVLLGGPVAAPLELKESHFLDVGRKDGFSAATYPRQPFLLEPPARRAEKIDDALLYPSQAPVGEYELLLYSGEKTPFEWTSKEWSQWLTLLQQRLLQFHLNPYLHFAYFNFHTKAIGSIEGYLRVGDLIATSHAIAGSPDPFSTEIANKLRKREELFVVEETPVGDLYVPSAPLHNREVWFIPKTYRTGIEQIEKNEREGLATILHTLMTALSKEFEEVPFCITIHTNMANMADDATWWLQVYQDDMGTLGDLNVRPLPEAFVQHLHFLLKHHL
jgi:hypothetical protein